MSISRGTAILLILFGLCGPARAGLYYSGELQAELPSQWQGFLIDQRALRNLAVIPSRPGPFRTEYQAAVRKLEEAAKTRKLSADEQADLGALCVRLGTVDKAVNLLRAAQREHPEHFPIAANLGTAWQLQGDLAQARLCLHQAVKLAPAKWKKAEELQLKLVGLRLKQGKKFSGLDDLFGVKFQAEGGNYAAGQLSAAERKKLPADAVALTQQLALWLPGDASILWQLAELANVQGDVRIAASIMDGCVKEFAVSDPELRQHRRVLRAAADALAKAGDNKSKTMHAGHVSTFKPRSRRPLLMGIRSADLPPIRPTGVNELPWSVLAETLVDSKAKATFPKYLRDLDGRQISLAGFMQPIRDDVELSAFLLIEYPVGCWYCETPEMTGLAMIQMPRNKAATLTRSLIKVTGKLQLNATDPEDFLFTIKDAKVGEAD